MLADKLDSYLEIQRSSPVAIVGGEHEYTRWGFRAIVENRAMDVLQPDIYWCGGISETVKICALASTFDLPVIPHNHSTHATAHLIASQPPSRPPPAQSRNTWSSGTSSTSSSFSLRCTRSRAPSPLRIAPGLGLEIDESKVTAERELHFDA